MVILWAPANLRGVARSGLPKTSSCYGSQPASAHHQATDSLRQLRHVPAAPERANQLHRSRELPGLQIGQRALVLQQGGFRSQDFEITGDPAFVSLVGDIEGA